MQRSLSVWFWLRASHEMAVTEGMTEAEGSSSKMVHSDDYQVGAECQWEASSLEFFIGLLEGPHDMAAGCPQWKGCKREQGSCYSAFYDLASEVTLFLYFSSAVFYGKNRPALCNVGRNYRRTWIQEARITGGHLGSWGTSWKLAIRLYLRAEE